MAAQDRLVAAVVKLGLDRSYQIFPRKSLFVPIPIKSVHQTVHIGYPKFQKAVKVISREKNLQPRVACWYKILMGDFL